jgi:aminomethyltransferase
MVPFAGWNLPVHFGSLLDEHHAVRRQAGMFDVCHMRAVDISGTDASAFLRRVLANDVQKLRLPGKALYSCLLREDGGVLDDLIVYFLAADTFRLVVNAGTAAKDIAWLQEQATHVAVQVMPRHDLGMIAVQGPAARELVLSLLPESIQGPVAQLQPFFALAEAEWFVARTGYTGEDGFEILLDQAMLTSFWQQLLEAGVQPCGLGARDTLRLEAGMNLYGQDMDEQVSPLSSGLAWTVDLRDPLRRFIGRDALEAEQAAGKSAQFVGLVLAGKGVLRPHQPLFVGDQPVGEVTSGGFAPTLQRSIALARIMPGVVGPLCVGIRKKRMPVTRVNPPFVRYGQVKVEV